MKPFFAALFVVLLGFAVYLVLHLGAFKDVEIAVETRGPFKLLYKAHLGPYHFINSTIEQVEKIALDKKWRCDSTFGEFLDDPSLQDHDRLRANVGCVIQVEPEESLPNGLLFEQRLEQKYIVAKFSGSPSISPFKVYPKVKEFVENQRLRPKAQPNIEIYTPKGDEFLLEVLFPIE